MPTEVQHGFTGECFPDHFNLNARPKIKEKKPGQLSDEEIEQFFTKGYVVIEKFFTKDELEPCKDAVNDQLECLAQKLYKTKRIKNLYRELGFYERLTAIEAEWPGANILMHKGDGLPQAFKDLWTNDRLLNVVEQLIGPEISGHPVWNLRTKTPQSEATTVPWHQDCGYLDNDCYKTLQPTAWIPLIDATEKNGCMQVASGGHQKGLVATHQCCYGNTWYVMLEEKEMEKTLDIDLEKDIITVPVPYGGMLLLNNLIPHRSLPNMSNQIRWSLDLRWQKPDLPAGFWGLKSSLLLRSAKDPDYKIDWTEFDGVNRREKQRDAVADVLPPSEDWDFETALEGPWMKKWELTHMNRHTDKLKDGISVSWHNMTKA